MDKIIAFIREKLSDLSVTYQTSSLSQTRCLFGSIFQSGVKWAYPGILNREFSPVYQAILDCSSDDAPDGDESVSKVAVTSGDRD